MKATGDWQAVKSLLAGSASHFRAGLETGLAQEAQHLRKLVVQGITQQAPGGEAFKALSDWTLAARDLKGFAGTKALLKGGDLRNAVVAMVHRDHAFVGVPRKAKDAQGQPLVDVAKLNEFGSDPIVIPITPAMRRFLFALGGGGNKGSGQGVAVVRIPARPFLRPAFKKFRTGSAERFLKRIASIVTEGGR